MYSNYTPRPSSFCFPPHVCQTWHSDDNPTPCSPSNRTQLPSPSLHDASSNLQLRLHPHPLHHLLHPLPRDVLVLRRRPCTAPHRPNHHAILHNRHATRNRREAPAVAVVDAERGAPGPDGIFVERGRGAVAVRVSYCAAALLRRGYIVVGMYVRADRMGRSMERR